MYKLYQIVNLSSNKKYIGYTERTLDDRFKQHLNLASSGKGYWLHKAIRKHGTSSFKIELLEEYESIKAVRKQEVKLIEVYGDYNIHRGGLGGDTLSNHPDISNIKVRMSKSHLKNQKRGKEHPRYIPIAELTRKSIITEYYSFELPTPPELIQKYNISSKDTFNRIFKESGNRLYRSKIERFKKNEKNIDVLMDYYVKSRLTVNQIAQKTNLHQDSISKILREQLDIPPGKKLHQKLKA